MKLDRVIWGVLLLFVGGVLLLDNFDIIDFYWRNVFRFFPVFIIILGVNMLFNRNNSQVGSIISLVIVVLTLGFLFFRGQERPEHRFFWSDNDHHFRYEDDDNNEDKTVDRSTVLSFAESFTPGDELKKNVLNISGGGTSFELSQNTTNLFDAQVEKGKNRFSLLKTTEDSTNVIEFRMKDTKRGSWNVGDGNKVVMNLNDQPIWDIHVKVGAGEVDFDLSKHKVRTFTFDGGVAELEVKIGDQLPITDVEVKSGLTKAKILVPQGSGCRIRAKTGLSSRDFEGFTKISDNLYETPNYKSSSKKVFVNFDGGLASFEVNRY